MSYAIKDLGNNHNGNYILRPGTYQAIPYNEQEDRLIKEDEEQEFLATGFKDLIRKLQLIESLPESGKKETLITAIGYYEFAAYLIKRGSCLPAMELIKKGRRVLDTQKSKDFVCNKGRDRIFFHLIRECDDHFNKVEKACKEQLSDLSKKLLLLDV